MQLHLSTLKVSRSLQEGMIISHVVSETAQKVEYCGSGDFLRLHSLSAADQQCEGATPAAHRLLVPMQFHNSYLPCEKLLIVLEITPVLKCLLDLSSTLISVFSFERSQF